MKPCWCKTITNLLVCINFHSNDCLWSSYEGPVIRFPTKQMRPINYLLWIEWCWNLQALHFLQVGKRKVPNPGNTRVFTQIRDLVLTGIDVPFIIFSIRLMKERHFHSSFKDGYILNDYLPTSRSSRCFTFNNYNKKFITSSPRNFVFPFLAHGTLSVSWSHRLIIKISFDSFPLPSCV